ncbi:tenascin-like [Saccostrea cucullata]|uniref:tenascin-like n=1 Tax=Saccostrea cuccullata TaxID=36930 RepID=UPI002ED3302A
MSCIYNNDCHGYGCGSSLYPQCANLDGHSRCLCEASSPSARHECEKSTDCTKCHDYQVGQCNHNQCTCSAQMSCIYNNDCHGYGCGSSLYPQCANLDGHSRCLCEASSPSARHECEQSTDCTKCHDYQVGQCNHNQCTCSAQMSCIYNNDCHGYGCGSSLYPQCANLDGHSRCLCEASSPSARHECEQSTDCTKCHEYQVGQCNHNQCTCSSEISCSYNNECHGYGCGSSLYPQCANLDGHSRCLCEASSPSAKHECEQSSDCTKCPEYEVGQCNHNQCTCSVRMSCSYNNDCHGFGCGSSLYPQCAKLDGYSRCLCEASSPSAKHECEQSSDCTKCPEYQVGQCNHNQCTCSAKMSCSYNNDCHGYGCGSSLYPQCANLDGHSRCLCEPTPSSTRHECNGSYDCTKCPDYEVGQCNLNQCTCSAERTCVYNIDCHEYGCGNNWISVCANLDGHSRCLCEPLSPTSRHECEKSSDCTKCPDDKIGQCKHNQCTCSDTTTTETTVFTTSAPSSTKTQSKLSTSIKSTTAGNTSPITPVKPGASSTISVISTSLLSTKKATTTDQGKSTAFVSTTMPTTAQTDSTKTTSYQSTISLG